MYTPNYEMVVAVASTGVVLGTLVEEADDVIVYKTEDDEYLMHPAGLAVVRKAERRLGKLPVRLAMGPRGTVR